MKKCTHIIATIGDNHIWDEQKLFQAQEAGVNIFRMSSAHNKEDDFYNLVKKSAPLVMTLQDLNEGVKKRISIKNDINVEIGHTVLVRPSHNDTSLTLEDNVLYIDWPLLYAKILPSNLIYIGDGEVALEVISTGDKFVKCSVLNNGTIRTNKALNVNGIESGIKAINKYNYESILIGAKRKYDYVAISFVSKASDIDDFWKVVTDSGLDYKPKVIAKIETLEGVKNIESILNNSDGIMIARGDLALQVDFHRLGVIQKQLLNLAKSKAKYCIIATQMLESIINRHIPSRAEILDISNAVYSGASAVMLSPESCINPDPITAISTMRKIIEEVEKDLNNEIY